MAYDTHATKRQRTDVDGHGVHAGNRDSFGDPHKPAPSPVVHVRGLSEMVLESDLVDALSQFGAVSFVLMLPRKRQALVEFEDSTGAQTCVEYTQQNPPLHVAGAPAFFNYSTSQKIQRQGNEERPCAILLFTILNPQYPITVDVMHTICSAHGEVLRVVIFKKNGLQCMVEFDSVETARRAKAALQGADIYSGCCTLKIEYAKQARLNVTRNDTDMWDYTNTGPGSYGDQNGGMPQSSYQRALQGGESPMSRSRGPASGAYGGGYGAGAMDTNGGSYGSDYGRRDRYGSQQMNSYGGGSYGGGPPGHDGFSSFDPGAGAGAGDMQQGSVLMVYGLNPEKVNASHLFNLFCIYGNVVKIKFLKSKEGAAMIQLGDNASCDRALQNINYCISFGSKLQLSYSKQAFLQDVPNPHDLPDGTSSFVDFMGNRNNRFTTPQAAQKNRIQQPSKVLHYFNAPPQLNDEEIKDVFIKEGAKPPSVVKVFAIKSESQRSSTGLIEWDEKSDALEALMLTNHALLDNPNGKNPFVFKLCFSSTPTIGGGGSNYQ